jgi:hypothetical protein
VGVCGDGAVSPTKAQQRGETLPRHRGGGRKERTPVGRLDSDAMRILSQFYTIIHGECSRPDRAGFLSTRFI